MWILYHCTASYQRRYHVGSPLPKESACTHDPSLRVHECQKKHLVCTFVHVIQICVGDDPRTLGSLQAPLDLRSNKLIGKPSSIHQQAIRRCVTFAIRFKGELGWLSAGSGTSRLVWIQINYHRDTAWDQLAVQGAQNHVSSRGSYLARSNCRKLRFPGSRWSLHACKNIFHIYSTWITFRYALNGFQSCGDLWCGWGPRLSLQSLYFLLVKACSVGVVARLRASVHLVTGH